MQQQTADTRAQNQSNIPSQSTYTKHAKHQSMNMNGSKVLAPSIMEHHGGGMSSQSNRQSLNMNPY